MKKLTIGLCTVSTRKVSYLDQTLRSVFTNMSPLGRQQIVVSVFNCNPKGAPDISFAQFQPEIDCGLLKVTRVENHPEFTNLIQNFGDSPERIYWRTKQNYDYSEAFRLSHDQAEYYMHIEDDLIACKEYDRYVFDVLEKNKDWGYIQMAAGGFIGLVFHNHDLPKMSSLLYGFRDEMPCDWLVQIFGQLKAASGRKALRFQQSIFQHVGYERTLANSVQPVTFDNFIQ